VEAVFEQKFPPKSELKRTVKSVFVSYLNCLKSFQNDMNLSGKPSKEQSIPSVSALKSVILLNFRFGNQSVCDVKGLLNRAAK